MKKNSLTSAVVMSLAGVAGIANISNAVNLNPDGTGQVLIYPYYTVNGNNTTIISVVNTTALGKAVKVRILEGKNSREVLDFNLYLSAFDVWTGGIFALGTDANAAGNLTTLDNSCTSPLLRTSTALPQLANGTRYADFKNFEYTGSFNDSAQDTLDRTREGYIEMIEMGSISPTNATGKFITHVNGVPRNCAAVDASWIPSPIDSRSGTYGDADLGTAATDVGIPNGGLFGGGAVVNAGDGTYINYAAEALDGFSAQTNHTFPGSTLPNLSNADPESFVFNSGRLIRSTWGTASVGTPTSPGQRIDAVSAVFMSNTMLNEFTSEAAQRASSEWVINFPTKSFYVDVLRAGPLNVPIAPFTKQFNGVAPQPFENGEGYACEPIAIVAFDREEGRPTPGSTIFSPPPPLAIQNNAFCYEAQILSFNQTFTTASGPSRIFASRTARNIAPRFNNVGFETGWVNIDYRFTAGSIPPGAEPLLPTRFQRASVEGHRFVGLPSTGFWAVNLENANARPGVQGFYGGAYAHKRGRQCSVGVTAASPACQ